MWRAWRLDKLRRRVAQARDECDRISRDGKYGFATTRLGVTDMELMGEDPGYSYLSQASPPGKQAARTASSDYPKRRSPRQSAYWNALSTRPATPDREASRELTGHRNLDLEVR